ncbi:major capsid protein [Desulfovibrio sp. ZJ200]|uniref:major capsid protein n=1 Tax=Desulfovibrio sp. ZJ200 TaxID=2709792 RepID=UPI0013EA2FD5|nr:major capsid protein [Desulfovibrio sp. ZJ200]
MLATLRNLFAPQAVAQSLKTLPPIESTIMDSYFKSRPAHPLPMIGITDLKAVVQTVPVVRREGAPIPLLEEEVETQYFAPMPIKVQVPVSAAELNDLRVLMGNQASLEAWRTRKVEQIRQTAHNTTEGMCAGVLTTGRLSWPVRLQGGRSADYGLDYGAPLVHDLSTKLTGASKLSAVYRLLRDMQQKIRMAGLGGKVEFLCGEDVAAVFLDMAENYRSTAQDAPIGIKLGNGEARIGSYVIRFMDETYPAPLSGEWVPKLDAKTLMAIAVDVPGTIWYCAIDSISANNAAVPMHIVPVKREDDSGITLIGQTKPMPARPSRSVCKCVAVA